MYYESKFKAHLLVLIYIKSCKKRDWISYIVKYLQRNTVAYQIKRKRTFSLMNK